MKKIFCVLWAASCVFAFSNTRAQLMISTVAGSGITAYSGDGGPATAAGTNFTYAVAADAGNFYFSAGDRHIRKVNASGIISTLAGDGTSGNSGDGGPATNARFRFPYGIGTDPAGNVYIADDSANVVRKVDVSTGFISDFAGTSVAGFSGDGGPATAAKLNQPQSIMFDTAGNAYIADIGNFRIRKVDRAGNITTICGTGVIGYSGDGGLATLAQVTDTRGLCADRAGNVYLPDDNGSVIRKINTAGIITTIAGTPGVTGYSGDGGAATAALLRQPFGIVADTLGNIFFVDASNSAVRKIDAAGVITTIAGGGSGFGGDGGPATGARFTNPDGIAIDPIGRLYVADEINYRIRLIYRDTRPYFTHGHTQALELCRNSAAVAIDTQLAAIDTDPGQNEAWTMVTPPSHGSLAGLPVYSTSAGSPMTPSGLTYTPAAGYAGTDMFSIAISDGVTADTTAINVSVDSVPVAGVILGTDTVCFGMWVSLSDVTAGGVWSSLNTSLATVSGTGRVYGTAIGSDTIYYTVTNICGTARTAHWMSVRVCEGGVSQAISDADVTIFPNPAATELVIRPGRQFDENDNLALFDVAGAVVLRAPLKGMETEVPLAGLAPGLYLCRLQLSGHMVTKKVVVDR